MGDEYTKQRPKSPAAVAGSPKPPKHPPTQRLRDRTCRGRSHFCPYSSTKELLVNHPDAPSDLGPVGKAASMGEETRQTGVDPGWRPPPLSRLPSPLNRFQPRRSSLPDSLRGRPRGASMTCPKFPIEKTSQVFGDREDCTFKS